MCYPLTKEAFEHITHKIKINIKIKIKAKRNAYMKKAQLYGRGTTDRNWFLDMIGTTREPEMAKGYRLRKEQHEGQYGVY